MSFSINNTIIIDNQIIVDVFNSVFVSIVPQLVNIIIWTTVSPLSYVHSVVNSIVISKITTLKIRNIILSTKNTSPGWDDTHVCMVNKLIDHYMDPPIHATNNSLQEGVFPWELKWTRVAPLFKSGESNQALDLYLYKHSSLNIWKSDVLSFSTFLGFQ